MDIGTLLGWSLRYYSRLRPRGKRTDHRLGLGIGEWTELVFDAARNRGGLAACLEAREVRAIAPRERSAQPHLGFDGGVVHDVDRALVVRRALPIAREIPEIAAGREDRRDSGHLG